MSWKGWGGEKRERERDRKRERKRRNKNIKPWTLRLFSGLCDC